MSDKTKKIALEKAMTWNGVNYAPGINTMPEDAVRYALKQKFGRAVDETEDSASETTEFTPLSVKETMKRFQTGDLSDEVVESMRFHKEAIFAGRSQTADDSPGKDVKTDPITESGGGNSSTEGSAKISENVEPKAGEQGNQQTPNDGLPQNFPMRHTFDKLGFKSVADVQALTKEKLIELNGVAETTAAKALAYGK